MESRVMPKKNPSVRKKKAARRQSAGRSKSKNKTKGRAPSFDRKIAERWTPALVRDGWTPISECFLKYYSTLRPEITVQEAMFIVHLMMHKWDRKPPYPAFKTIAARMGCGHQAARGYARSLEKKKYLRREMRVNERNLFHLDGLFNALEERLVEEKKKAKAKQETEGRRDD